MKPDIESYIKINNACLVALTGIAMTGALIYTRSILIPFIFAIFIYSIASAAIKYIQDRFGLQKSMAVLTTLLAGGLLSGLTIFFVVSSIQSFIRSAYIYENKMVAFIDWASGLADRFGYSLDAGMLKQKMTELPLLEIAQNLTGDAFTILGNIFLIFIFTLFLAMGGQKEKQPHPLLDQIKLSISRYIFMKWVASVLAGLIVWITLTICGVELAFMFAWLAFLLNFIPNVGSIIATAFPLPIVILQYGFGWQFWVVLGVTVGAQFILGSFFEPKLIGDSVDLHPITILIFLMFWGLVWGIPGMFLAVPITAVLKIIFSKIETTKPLAELLAGRMG